MLNKIRKTTEDSKKNNLHILILIFLLIFIVRLPFISKLLNHPDEKVYFTVAQQISQGAVLYRDVWDHKGPLLYFLFVPVIKLFGPDITALRLFTTIYLMISMWFVYLLAKRVFPSTIAVIVPFVYGLFFSHTRLGNLSQCEMFMFLPIIAAWLIFYPICFEDNRSNFRLFFCGCLLALAFLIKMFVFGTIIMFLSILGGKYIFKKEDRGKNFKTLVLKIFYFFAGFGLIHFLFLAYFYLNNSLTDYINGYYAFNFKHVSSYSWIIFFRFFLMRTFNFLSQDYLTVGALLAGLSIVFNLKKYRKDRALISFVFSMVFAGVIPIILSMKMLDYYFLCLSLGNAFIIGLYFYLLDIDPRNLEKIIFVTVMVFLFYYLTIFCNDFFFKSKLHKVDDRVLVAEFLKNNMKANDRLICYCESPGIYFLSQGRPSIKYFNAAHYAESMRKHLFDSEQFEAMFLSNRPNYIVVGPKDHKWKRNRVLFIEQLIEEKYNFQKAFGVYKIYKLNQKAE
ncbi:MAG: glycosyltransferase family 39 protein [Candidatus Omnitrophica bacterium]|nr:glycosyltransferase family 39 protein [Candidatus Omnitrophota bacterium]